MVSKLRVACSALVLILIATLSISAKSAQTAISADGIVESTVGGFKFPDNSVQASAVTPGPQSNGLLDGAHHRFVSTKGDDTNPCTLASPCRSFAAGVAAAEAGGKVVAIDSGDYGPFLVTKSLTVEAAPGVHAGITVFTGTGVTVNTPAGEDVVVLRGLEIHNSGGEDGINIFMGQTHIENCMISGFKGNSENDGSQAVHVYKEALITDSVLVDNDRAVWVDGGGAVAWIGQSRVETNSTGVFVSCGGRAVVFDSTVSNNFAGVDAGCGAPTVLVDSSMVARNFVGIQADDTGSDTTVIRVANSSVVYNVTGLQQIGESSLLSRGDNTIEDNDTDTSGTIGSYSAR